MNMLHMTSWKSGHQSNQSTIYINQGTKLLKEGKKTNLIINHIKTILCTFKIYKISDIECYQLFSKSVKLSN